LNIKTPQLFLLSLILFLHVFSVFFPANASMHAALAKTKNKDITAICSGNGKVKWVKLSEFYLTGTLVFVEAPSNTEQVQNSNNTCAICSVFNHLDHNDMGLMVNTLHINDGVNTLAISFYQNFTQQITLIPSSRDPPFFN